MQCFEFPIAALARRKNEYTCGMSMKRILLRLLIAVFALNASGLAFGAGNLASCLAHDIELASVPAGVVDSEHALPNCKHGCESHCAQHLAGLPAGYADSSVPNLPRQPVPGATSRAPTGTPSSLFRPPRLLSL